MLQNLINELDISWVNILNKFIQNENNTEIIKKINNIISLDNITPKKENILNALKLTPFDKIKVVILGQDPYPEKGKAHGLAFSYNDNSFNLDSSLENIFSQLNKTIKNENNIFLNKDITNNTNDITEWNRNLSSWAKNGIFLLNTALTTFNGEVGIHLEEWKPFTKYIIEEILRNRLKTKKRICIFLWGNPAKNLFIESIKNINNSNFIINKLKTNTKIIDASNIKIFFSYHPSKLAEASKNNDLKFSQNATSQFNECNRFLSIN